MNISEIKQMLMGASYEKELDVLETIYEYAGNDVMNGYLGSSVVNVSYDKNGKVEFESKYMNGEFMTTSVGAVLENSVLIKQVQECGDKDFCQLISWKCDGSSYTCIIFDDENNMVNAYEKLKKSHGEYLEENIHQILDDLGISFNNIMNIKTSQSVEQQSISVDDIIEAYDDSSISENLEVVKSIA